ncbi:MAG: tryptophan-rich sensory protein [Eubacteriales bacterium]|nr:tryptophan-rich sensory protein [Eubacteriales bacterium]
MKKISTVCLFQGLNVLFFLGMVVVNALANILPINNQTTGEISDKYPNLFVPAAITFAIWGVIYVALALFMLYQSGILTGKSGVHKQSVMDIGPWFIISSLANMAWILLWHYNFVYLSLIAMALILYSLIRIQIKVNRQDIRRNTRWFCQIPFSIYFGWITVATIANVTAALVNAGWTRFGLPEAGWTIIMISIAAVITLIHLLLKKDIAYGLAIIWAFAGIFIKHVTTFETSYPGVVLTISLCTGMIVVVMFFSKTRWSSVKQLFSQGARQ